MNPVRRNYRGGFAETFVAILMVTVWLPALCVVPARATGEWKIVLPEGSDLLEIHASDKGSHKLEIDDAVTFRTPLLTKTFRGSSLQIHALDSGIIPGISYHARLDAQPGIKNFRVQLTTFSEPEASCSNLRRNWERIGRHAAGDSHSRVGWDAARGTWVVLEHGPLIGNGLYYVEYYLRPALEAARACNDLQTLDEIAKYYVTVLQFTEPLGTLLSNPNVLHATKERMATADPSALVIPAEIAGQPADGELAMSQWLHPAAEFLRLVSLLPSPQRTPAMQSFASQYTKFIAVDQLDRYLVQQRLPFPGGGEGGRIELWKRDLAAPKGASRRDTAFTDIDLWLMASAAEVLGANANDPTLAPLTAPQAEVLHRAVEIGSRFVESRRYDYPGTENLRGEKVGSLAFAIGDFDDDSSFAYSGVTSEEFPTPAEKRPLANVGWDIAHAYRLPVFMRALYENRKATGVDWPPLREVQLFTNQYVYRVFNGDFARPLFHTHLDGSDGWYRVGFNGGDYGIPPSRYCDQHNPRRPCQSPGSIMGWGLLAFASPDLAHIEQALVKLALDPSPEAQQFRDRYYFYEEPFAMAGGLGQQIYGTGLYFLIGDNAGMIADPSKPKPHENF